jgi:hypothetical protein
MQLLSLITFVASATAAALPAAALEERAACTFADPAALVKAKAAFQAAKIVPDVIPRFDPTLELSVAYGSKAVNFGNTFNTIGKSLPSSPPRNDQTTKPATEI